MPAPDPSWVCQPDRPVPDDVARLLGTVPQWFGIPEANPCLFMVKPLGCPA